MKVSHSKFVELLKCFAYDVTATQAAKLAGVNRNTANRYYNEFRMLIYKSHYNEDYKLENATCEIDESYFGGKRIRGKAGRGAYGKKIVFGIIARNGDVFAQVVENCSSETLIPIIQARIAPNCVINSDMWPAYRKISKLGYTHKTINHSANKFAHGETHTNSIENFWGYCKQRLSKFNGLCKHNFHLYIRECEYRFNHRKKDVYKELKKLIRTSWFSD